MEIINSPEALHLIEKGSLKKKYGFLFRTNFKFSNVSIRSSWIRFTYKDDTKIKITRWFSSEFTHKERAVYMCSYMAYGCCEMLKNIDTSNIEKVNVLITKNHKNYERVPEWVDMLSTLLPVTYKTILDDDGTVFGYEVSYPPERPGAVTLFYHKLVRYIWYFPIRANLILNFYKKSGNAWYSIVQAHKQKKVLPEHYDFVMGILNSAFAPINPDYNDVVQRIRKGALINSAVGSLT